MSALKLMKIVTLWVLYTIRFDFVVFPNYFGFNFIYFGLTSSGKESPSTVNVVILAGGISRVCHQDVLVCLEFRDLDEYAFISMSWCNIRAWKIFAINAHRILKCCIRLRRNLFLLNKEAQRATYCAPEYNVPNFWRIGQGGHFCLLIGRKKHKLSRGRSDLASWQLSLNSIRRFQRKI